MYSNGVVARRMQTLRAAKGMSQEDLAKASGIPQSTVTRYELAGMTMGLDKAYKIAEALGCTLDELAGRSPMMIGDEGAS